MATKSNTSGKTKVTTIKGLKAAFNENTKKMNEILLNHKEAHDSLRRALEAHLWEPDAHNPAFLAHKKTKAKKDKK